MKKLKYEFEVDDDFKIGCCMDCPLHIDEELYGDYFCSCAVLSSYENCPLKEVKNVEITR